MAEWGVDVKGLTEALGALDKFQVRAEDQTPVWQVVAKFLHKAAVARFRPGSQPTSWPALKHPHAGPMLVRSGKMRDKIIERVKKNGVIQYSRQRYSWVQHHGSKTGIGYIKGSAFAALSQAAGSSLKYKSGKKGRRTQVWVGGRWVYVAKRGGKGRGKTRRLFREQAGRGGIQARPFVYVEEEQLIQVQEAILAYLVEAFDEEGATRGPA